MTGVLQGALGGGRALLVGWFVPSFVNLLVFGFVIVPQTSGFQALAASGGSEAAARSTIFALVGTTVVGLTLAALQTPLYRILEGYLGWPERMFGAGRHRQLARKHLLQNRLDAAYLVSRETAGTLTDTDSRILKAFRSHPVTGRFVASDARRGPVWLSLLDERLSRFPADDRQVTPTRLGNAIRRFEEYGYDRFRLDSQVLWHELNAVVPEPARKQAEDARTTVDFFVCLLYGHLLVAFSACAALVIGTQGKPWLAATAIVALPLLAAVWYRVAVAATDDWAGAVRAMVNLGRQPLATSMGLSLPETNNGERAMWTLTAELARGPYTPAMAALDRYRSRDNALSAEAGAIETGALPSGGAADANNGPVPGEGVDAASS
jgi:hypothetical protein